jgi:hypothetical protein
MFSLICGIWVFFKDMNVGDRLFGRMERMGKGSGGETAVGVSMFKVHYVMYENVAMKRIAFYNRRTLKKEASWRKYFVGKNENSR